MQHRSGGHDFEEAVFSKAFVFCSFVQTHNRQANLPQHVGEFRFGNQLATDREPFSQGFDMWRAINAGQDTGFVQRAGDHAADRAFPFGPRHVND